MIKIEIDNKEYNLPSGWEDITLKKFEQITEFLTRDYKENTKSELRKSIDLISLLMECDPDTIYLLSRISYMELAQNITWILEAPTGTVKKFFTINGISYMSPPNMDQLSLGEVVSIETIIQNDPKDLAGILSIIIRPRISVFNNEKQEEEYEQEKFDIKNYSYRKELFLDNLKVTDVIGLCNFFINGEKVSL